MAALTFDEATAHQTLRTLTDVVVVKETVALDGRIFERCRFLECRMVYAGGEPPKFVDCTYKQSDWVFEGAADRTLVTLAAIYHGFGDGDESLIEAVFDSIRQGAINPNLRNQRVPLPASAPSS